MRAADPPPPQEVPERPSKVARHLLHVPKQRDRTKASAKSGGNRPANFQKKRVDPVKLVDALDFSKYLRDQRDFSNALQAATDFDRAPDAPAVDRDASEDPRRSSLQRARKRLDVVALNIERRLFHAEVEEDAIASIHCYSDASPVTGCEIQGSIAEVVRKDGGVRKVCLPAGSLSYGHCDSINKGVFGSGDPH